MIARILAIIVLLFALPGTLLAAEPFARAEVLTKGKIVAGQQVEIAVDIYVPNFFKGAPDFPLFPLEGAIVTLPEQRALNLNETIDEVDYSGIRKSYMVMAQHAGDFAFPPLKFDVAYADDDGKTVEGKATLPKLTFTAGDVPGDWGDQTPLVTTSLKVTQTLDRDPAKLKVGEALVRTVSLIADDTQPMMLPELDFAAPDNVKVYRADPSLVDAGQDKDNPDAAIRKERVTYVVDKAGRNTIPAIDVRWFNSESGKMESAEAPAVTLSVAANPAAQVIPASAPSQSLDQIATRRAVTRSLIHTALVALAALVLYFLFYLAELRLRAWLGRVAAQRAQSEHTYFKQALRALTGPEPTAGLTALDRWTQRMGYRSSTQWVEATGSVELKTTFHAFQRSLFRDGSQVEARSAMAALATVLPTARATQRTSARTRSRGERILPPLNAGLMSIWVLTLTGPNGSETMTELLQALGKLGCYSYVL